LEAFVAKGKTVPKMSLVEADSFRYVVYAELQKAMIQYAMDRSQMTTGWVEIVGEMLKAIEDRMKVEKADSVKFIAAAQARRAQLAKDPDWKPKQYTVN
jgi:hypothetical protein